MHDIYKPYQNTRFNEQLKDNNFNIWFIDKVTVWSIDFKESLTRLAVVCLIDVLPN
jgi:DNA-dependent RNA polymerase auxiliary subunit epsilon